MVVVRKRITVLKRGQRTLADGELAVAEFDERVHVIVAQLVDIPFLRGYIRRGAPRLVHNHLGFDLRKEITERFAVAGYDGILEQKLDLVVALEDVVLDVFRLEHETVLAVEAFEINRLLATRVVDRRFRGFYVFAHISLN